MERINKWLSWFLILCFCFEIVSLLLVDDSHNKGASKGLIVAYFFFTYVWSIVLALVSVFKGSFLAKKKALLTVVFFLNVVFCLFQLRLVINFF